MPLAAGSWSEEHSTPKMHAARSQNSDTTPTQNSEPPDDNKFLLSHPQFPTTADWVEGVNSQLSLSPGTPPALPLELTVCDLVSRQTKCKWRCADESVVVVLVTAALGTAPDHAAAADGSGGAGAIVRRSALVDHASSGVVSDAFEKILSKFGSEKGRAAAAAAAAGKRIKLRRMRQEKVLEVFGAFPRPEHLRMRQEKVLEVFGAGESGQDGRVLPRFPPLFPCQEALLGNGGGLMSPQIVYLLDGRLLQRVGSRGRVVVGLTETKSLVVSDWLRELETHENAEERLVWSISDQREPRVDEDDCSVRQKAAESSPPRQATVVEKAPQETSVADRILPASDFYTPTATSEEALPLEILETSTFSSKHLDDFRDLRKTDNNFVRRVFGGGTEEEELVYAEGGSTIEQALENENTQVRLMLMKRSQFVTHKNAILEKAREQMRRQRGRFEDVSVLKVVLAPPDVLKQVLEVKTLGPCTVLAICTKPPNTPLFLAPNLLPRRVVVLDGLTNAENVGSIIRTASCFGVQAIVLSKDCCTCWSRRAVRVSMGHCFRIPIFVETEEWGLERVFKALTTYAADDQRNGGFTTYAAVVQEETKFLHKVAWEDISAGFVVVVGSEGPGISRRVRALCDEQLTIKMAPGNDSFNVGVATSIVLNHFFALGSE